MSDGTIQLPYTATTSGKILDTEQLTVGAETVQRERMQITGAAATEIAPVTSSGGLLVTNSTTKAVLLSSEGLVQIIPVTSSGVNLYTTQGVSVVLTGSSGVGAPVTSSAGVVVDTRAAFPALQFFTITVSSSGGTKELIAASGSLKIKVVSYAIVASSANELRWLSSGTTIVPAMVLTSGGGIALAGSRDSWLFETSAGGNLRAGLEAAGYVTGHGSYFYEV